MTVKTNRLLPAQFAQGVTLDGSRIGATRDRLIELLNTLPPDLVAARWCPTHIAQSFLPSQKSGGAPTGSLPFMPWLNDNNRKCPLAGQVPTNAQLAQNTQRAKSVAVPFPVTTANLYIWETSFFVERPSILAALTLFAEDVQDPYLNKWLYGTSPPTGKSAGQATDDVSLQICVDDLYQSSDRKRLKQEAVLFNYDTAQMLFNTQDCSAISDTAKPGLAGTTKVFNGKAIRLTPYILLPEYSRVRIQLTIPNYSSTFESFRFVVQNDATMAGDSLAITSPTDYIGAFTAYDWAAGVQTPAQIATTAATAYNTHAGVNRRLNAHADGAAIVLTSNLPMLPISTGPSIGGAGAITVDGVAFPILSNGAQTKGALGISSWGVTPWAGNTWSQHINLWEAVR